jgi:hypothetical protein
MVASRSRDAEEREMNSEEKAKKEREVPLSSTLHNSSNPSQAHPAL